MCVCCLEERNRFLIEHDLFVKKKFHRDNAIVLKYRTVIREHFFFFFQWKQTIRNKQQCNICRVFKDCRRGAELDLFIRPSHDLASKERRGSYYSQHVPRSVDARIKASGETSVDIAFKVKLRNYVTARLGGTEDHGTHKSERKVHYSFQPALGPTSRVAAKVLIPEQKTRGIKVLRIFRIFLRRDLCQYILFDARCVPYHLHNKYFVSFGLLKSNKFLKNVSSKTRPKF